MEFKDISSEAKRTYTFHNGTTLTIEKPLRLNVSESGGHRVEAEGGKGYYVAAESWTHIEWTAKPGAQVMVA